MLVASNLRAHGDMACDSMRMHDDSVTFNTATVLEVD